MTEIIELFQALERNKNDGSFGSDMRQMVALLNLLIRVAPTLNVATAGESIQNKDFLRVSPILDYIRDNLSEPLTLDQIAGQFYISKHYLCRIFKAATGFSVMEYIIYSRVLQARQLLQKGVSVQQAGSCPVFQTTPTSSAPSATSQALLPESTPRVSVGRPGADSGGTETVNGSFYVNICKVTSSACYFPRLAPGVLKVFGVS